MPGGLRIRNSRKDFLWEKSAFGASRPLGLPIVPLGRLEELLASPLTSFPIYQGGVPSCVAASFTFLNQWNSWKETGVAPRLSWPFLYSAVKHYPSGTIPQEIADALRTYGQCLDERLPQSRFTNDPASADIAPFPFQALKDAEKYKIASYLFHGNRDITSLITALKDAPIIIGITVDPATWGQEVATYTGRGFKHACILIDVTLGMRKAVVSWDRNDQLDIHYLSSDYPIELAISVRDLSDDVDRQKIRRGYWFEDFFRKLLSH